MGNFIYRVFFLHCILLDNNHFEKKTKANSKTLEQKYLDRMSMKVPSKMQRKHLGELSKAGGVSFVGAQFTCNIFKNSFHLRRLMLKDLIFLYHIFPFVFPRLPGQHNDLQKLPFGPLPLRRCFTSTLPCESQQDVFGHRDSYQLLLKQILVLVWIC